MSRARATALTLVNWKGVFYERYLLDRHVTALEGANGAGKTTVMIAAYVVLLPDLSRLRFTNLGETGATAGDRGIWGRLGDVARPSYAALQIEAPGRKALFGVILERKTEPALQLTPFCISEYADNVRIQDLLLHKVNDADSVPTLDEFKANVAAHGAKLQIFSSVKEYFAKWFEWGIGPLRLSSDEDRNKWNEMLRTSMTGGISRALTSELRSFVLKQETGLSDTLSRMRSNLTACRKTRTEVSEARVLEHEISGIYDAGQAFFACAALAVGERAREASASLRAATQSLDALRAQAASLDAVCTEYVSRRGTLAARVSAAETARVAAAERVHKLQRVKHLVERKAALEPELAELRAVAEEARSRQALAQSGRAAGIEQRNALQLELKASAEGLANLQAGLSELHRRAFAYKRATGQQKKLRAQLKVDVDNLQERAATEARLTQEIAEIDAEFARRERRISVLSVRRSEYDAALSALKLLDPKTKAKEDAFEAAKRALQSLTRLDVLGASAEELSLKQKTALQLGTLQAGLQRQLRELCSEINADGSAEFVEWLHGLETQARTLEEQVRSATAESAELATARNDLERELQALRKRQAAHQKAAQLVARLVKQYDIAPSRDALREAKRALLSERTGREQRELRAGEEREKLLSEIAQLESGTLANSADISALCDELEGEHLSRRFEELELGAAREQQARLGQLLSAIVVEDPLAAARSLQKYPLQAENVYLVPAGTDPNSPLEQLDIPGYLAVRESYGLRLTRVPDAPLLGNAARERSLRDKNKAVQDLDAELEQLETSRQQLGSALADLEELEALAHDWLLGDPQAAIEGTKLRVSELEERQAALRELQNQTNAELGQLRARLANGRAVLPELYLLEQPNQLELASLLGEQLLEARAAEAELSRVATARQRLGETLHVLAEPMPTDAELSEWEAGRAKLEQRRDECFALNKELAEFAQNHNALAWHDAQRVLDAQVEIAPELQSAHERVLQRQAEAEAELSKAEQSWEQATRDNQQAQAKLEAALAHHARLQAEVDAEGEAEGAGVFLAAEVAERAAAKHVAELGSEAATIAAESGRAEERVAQARLRCETEEKREKQLAAAARPAEDDYQRLIDDATRAGLSQSIFSESVQQEYASWSCAALFAEARSKFALLCDRLETARGGVTLVEELWEMFNQEPRAEAGSGGETTLQARSALRMWQAVRAWLAQRVPARIAEAGDPLEALQRLRDDLRRLETRLSHQENDLRGNSEDVGRNIDLQCRKASTQVRRLNQYLQSIRFGSIAGIRVHLERVQRMDQVLEALRNGAAQTLLFQSNLPIEEALEEIFKRYAGGKGAGFRLLDYREYLELSVEVQRARDSTWEIVNPSRLSTGEAIGVGAALMMVVLTEWERDANLLRAERGPGTLRFLFLDEANRLSRDNLGTLFELCQTLDLQLLIAAPEVAQVDGNTTYRLVRRITEDGREEVVANGRRASMPSESAPVESVSAPAAEE